VTKRGSRNKQTEGEMSGHAGPKLLTAICVLIVALAASPANGQAPAAPAVQNPTSGPPPAPATPAMPPAPAVPPAPATVTTPICENLPKTSAGGASVVQAADENLQHKNWQAEGGEIQFAVKSPTSIPDGASVVLCFRWKSKAQHDVKPKEQPASRIDLSDGGKLLKITTTVPKDLGIKAGRCRIGSAAGTAGGSSHSGNQRRPQRQNKKGGAGACGDDNWHH